MENSKMKAKEIYEKAKKKRGDMMRVTVYVSSELLDDIKEIKRHSSLSKTVEALLKSYLTELKALRECSNDNKKGTINSN